MSPVTFAAQHDHDPYVDIDNENEYGPPEAPLEPLTWRFWLVVAAIAGAVIWQVFVR